MPAMITSKEDSGNLLFDIIKKFLNKSLTIDEELITKLNNMYYGATIENYILLPLAIYAIKESM